MYNVNYDAAALFEQRFWLQILGDHARFILGALAPVEQEEIQPAECFIQSFDQLLEQARCPLDRNELMVLNQTSYQKALELRAFKLHLLERLLSNDIQFHLPPTFINHMVNEIEEYLRINGHLLAGELPPLFGPLHLHLLWLPDASGHASAITINLDMVEKKLIHISEGFSQQFSEFYLKAVELAGYMRSNLKQFPALTRFNKEVELELLLFQDFLCELEELDLKAEVLGTLLPLFPDHMAREECYYLTKLSQVSEVKQPQCDPTKPRVAK
ncbi:MAG: hypothetical protein JWM44_399 [Bacilli bacterium]|nr:hypothetical protein [Bacilli bacterium]